MKPFTALQLHDNLYRLDLWGEVVVDGDIIMETTSSDGRVCTIVDKKTLQAIRAEIDAALTGRQQPKLEDLNPEDLA